MFRNSEYGLLFTIILNILWYLLDVYFCQIMGSYANPEIFYAIEGSTRLGEENSYLVYNAYASKPVNETQDEDLSSETHGNTPDGNQT